LADFYAAASQINAALHTIDPGVRYGFSLNRDGKVIVKVRCAARDSQGCTQFPTG